LVDVLDVEKIAFGDAAQFVGAKKKLTGIIPTLMLLSVFTNKAFLKERSVPKRCRRGGP
jgi:hypothetical protein